MPLDRPVPSRAPSRAKRLLGFLRRFLRHRRHLVAGLVCIPIVALADIGITLWFGDALNRLQQEKSADFLPRLTLWILALAAVQGVFRYLQRWWIVGVSRRFEVELKQDLFDRLVHLPLSFHVKSRSGDVVSRVTSDVENLRMLLGPGSMYVLGALTMVPGSLFVLARISAPVTVAMVLPLLVVVFVMRALSPRLQQHSMAVQESLSDVSQRAQESFSGIRIVKGYGLDQHENERFRASSGQNRGHQVELAHARGLQDAGIHFGHDLAFLPILVVGGWAMIDRSIAAGDLLKFVDLGFKVFWPVIALGWIAGLYPRAVVSAERIDELLDSRSDLTGPEHPRPLPEVEGSLSLRDVGFQYPGSARPALSGVRVEVPAGTTLGVVGPTGSGKSTLLGLLGRLHEATGEVRLDDVPIRELDLGTLRQALAYVPQDSFLFSDTYRANLEFGAEGVLDDARLHELIERVSMAEEVAAFPAGLDQLIGERGVTLSGGQRQRTCIARALAREPRVLILDDALSAVDTETEARLLASLRRAGKGRTVVVAAHRLGTVRDAERILVLDQGRVTAQGTHAELLQRSDWYRTTWDRQRMTAELEGEG